MKTSTNQIEITNEKDKEILNKWVKMTGNAIPPHVDPLRFGRLCLFYRNVNGHEPKEEISNKIESRLQFLRMEEMISEYERIYKEIFG